MDSRPERRSILLFCGADIGDLCVLPGVQGFRYERLGLRVINSAEWALVGDAVKHLLPGHAKDFAKAIAEEYRLQFSF